MPPKFKALVHEECRIRTWQEHLLVPLQLLPLFAHRARLRHPDPSAPDTLWVVVSIEGGLQDASGEDDFILGWKIVSIDSLGRHAPPGGGRSRLVFFSPHAAQPDSPGLPCLPPARALGHSSPHPQKPWSTSPAAPCLPAHSHWSRLGGLRSWSAITLAEKLYRFNMFWKKESSETSYCGNSGRKKARDNMLEKGRVPAGPFQASPSLLHCKMEGNG